MKTPILFKIRCIKNQIAACLRELGKGVKKYALDLFDLECQLEKLEAGMSQLAERINQASQRSEREMEIIKNQKPYQGLRGLSPALVREFRQLELDRENLKKSLLREGWEQLQKLGYKKVSYIFNAAVESGHSDYDDVADRGSKQGIETPTGEFIDGIASWTGALIPAISHAGL